MRGGDQIRLVILGDGADWIWNLATRVCPQATQILDLYHACEHLTGLADHLAFITGDSKAWPAERTAELDKLAGYFEKNTHRMR